MSRRKTIEEFVAQARARHGDTYDYSKVKYISGQKKVIIVCPVHGDFEQTPSNHLTGGSSRGAGCVKCSWEVNKQPQEQFILRAQKIHENKYDYSKVTYVNSYTKVTIGCPLHGDFAQTPDAHARQRAGCRECHFERKRETLEGFITRAREIHGDRYDYSKAEYKGSVKNITIVCVRHGEFEQLPSNHLSQRASGCRFCAWEDEGLRRRKTTNKFIEDAIKTHGNLYDYSKVEYTLGKSNVKIICKKHGEFEQIADNHLYGHACPTCSKIAGADKTRMPIEEFMARATQIYGDRYDYSKVNYVNKREKVTVKCAKHGEFQTTPGNFLAKKKIGISGGVLSGCPKCAGRYTQEMFISRAIETHGDKYDYSLASYIDSGTEVIIICPEHGQFKQRPQDHCGNGYGCKDCGIESRRQFHVKTLEQFTIDAREFHGDTYDYSKVEYINTNTGVVIGCPEHGDFKQLPSVHIRGSNCPKCARKNSTESMFREALETIFSKFGDFKFPNTRPEWLRNPNTNYKLELDCFNKDLKLAFEFHGQQHFKPIDAWGGEKEYIKIRRRDHFTRFYCRKNGITLIEVDGRGLTRIRKSRRKQALQEEIESKLKNLRPEQKQQLMKRLKEE